MSDKTPEQIEIESLRNHNAELLNDLKKAKAKVNTLTEELDAMTKDRDAKVNEYKSVTLDGPVNDMLNRISVMPEYFQSEFNARGYEFSFKNGQIVVQDASGNRIKFTDEKGKLREVEFCEADIKRLVLEEGIAKDDRTEHAHKFEHLIKASMASGGDAPGGANHGNISTSSSEKPQRLNAGLR